MPVTLPQFPAGCGGCNGACCKSVTKAPWLPFEIATLDSILGHERASEERFRLAENHGHTECWHLTDDGLCGLQLAGLQKPIECVNFVVSAPDCLNERRVHGLGD